MAKEKKPNFVSDILSYQTRNIGGTTSGVKIPTHIKITKGVETRTLKGVIPLCGVRWYKMETPCLFFSTKEKGGQKRAQHLEMGVLASTMAKGFTPYDMY